MARANPTDPARPSDSKPRALVLHAHVHGDRSNKRDFSLLQPMAGLQIASLIDPAHYTVELYLETWHGSLTPEVLPPADIVFMSGLAKDLDRMRQLSYYYRRAGSLVVVGGYLPTQFPEFCTQFFDVVCSGGVDSVREVMRDYENGTLKPIYRSPQTTLSQYEIDYSILARAGIKGPVHLVEASRGCNFTCDFCVIPAEGARHTKFGVKRTMRAIDASLQAAPRGSVRRLFPTVLFIDNNFSNDRKYLRDMCANLKAHPRVRDWGALITQDALKDRDLIREMSASGCSFLFTGLESLDLAFLKKHSKFQNLKRGTDVVEDIAFAQSQGIVVNFGYLLDPRMNTVEEMRGQIATILKSHILLFPAFIAIVSPIVGTKLFYEACAAGELRPNLRLRDIDGQTIVYANCRNTDAELSDFCWAIFRRPHTLISRRRMWINYLKRAWLLRRASLFAHIAHYGAHFRMYALARGRKTARTETYIAGTERLDLGYELYPEDITPEDKARYFDPILVTDAEGHALAWLQQGAPAPRGRTRWAHAAE
jgi:hypothetical protein